MAPSRSARWPLRRAIAILLPVFAFYALPLGFAPALPPGYESSHVFLAMAIEERGSLDVDVEAAEWFIDHDLLKIDGHYRSNKPPGPALWLVPAVAAVDALTPGRPDFWTIAWVGRVAMLSLAFVVFLFALGRGLERLAPPAVAWGLVLAYGLASNAAVYATRYYGHDLAAIAHASAWLVLLRANRRPLDALWVGLLAGVGVACEYRTIGIAVVVFATAVVIGPRRVLATLLGAIGAALPAIALVAYRDAAFATNVIHAHRETAEIARFGLDGALGFTWPSPRKLVALLASPAIGLWFQAPWLLLAIPAIVVAVRRGGRAGRGVAVAAGIAFAVHLVLVASHAFWIGGATAGPRYLTAALPLLLFPIAGWLGDSHTRPGMRVALAAGAVAGLVFHAALLVTWPAVHTDADFLLRNPFRAHAIPLLASGHVAPTALEVLGIGPVVATIAWLGCASIPIALWVRFARVPVRAIGISGGIGALLVLAQATIGVDDRPADTERRDRIASALDREHFPRRDGRIAFAPRPSAIEPRPAGATIERLDPRASAVLPGSTRIEVVAEPFGYLRAPLWHAGALLVADTARNTLLRYRPGALEIVAFHSGHAGANTAFYPLPGTADLAALPDGRIVETEHGDRCVATLDGETLVDRIGDARLNSPNHVAVRGDGTIYFTDPPFGLRFLHGDPAREIDVCGVYRIRDDRTDLIVDKIAAPTGIALSPDERYLYVGDWSATRRVIRFTLDAAGGLVDAAPFADLSNTRGVDGIAVDDGGRVWVCTPGALLLFDADGTALARVAMPGPVTDVAFAPDDVVYVTTRGALVRITRSARPHD